MNEDNKERPFSKLVLEIGPLIIFFVCYYKAPIPENIVNDIDAAMKCWDLMVRKYHIKPEYRDYVNMLRIAGNSRKLVITGCSFFQVGLFSRDS